MIVGAVSFDVIMPLTADHTEKYLRIDVHFTDRRSYFQSQSFQSFFFSFIRLQLMGFGLLRCTPEEYQKTLLKYQKNSKRNKNLGGNKSNTGCFFYLDPTSKYHF